MSRLVVIATLIVAALCGYFVVSLAMEVDRQDEKIHALETELAAARLATVKAQAVTADDHALYRLLVAIADHAKYGAPLSLLRYDRKFETLHPADIKEIATLLNKLTPRDGLEKVQERFSLSEYQVRVLKHLLFIPDRLQKDAPGYAEFELEPLRELTLTAEGLGPITLGTTLDEASGILQLDLSASPFSYGDEDCYSTAVGTGEYEWLARFIAVKERIGVIDIYGPGIATDRGIDVDSTMRDAMAAYPDGKLYSAHDAYERVWHVPLDGDRYLAFTGSFIEPGDTLDDEEGEGRIRAITLGRRGVGSVEGCL